MSLPTRTALLLMTYSWRGQPFVHVEAKPLSTLNLDFAWRGVPFVAAAVDASGPVDCEGHLQAAPAVVVGRVSVTGSIVVGPQGSTPRPPRPRPHLASGRLRARGARIRGLVVVTNTHRNARSVAMAATRLI